MLIPSVLWAMPILSTSLSRRVNANSQHKNQVSENMNKLIKKGEC